MAKKVKPVGRTNFTGHQGQLWKAEVFLNSDHEFYISIPNEIVHVTGIERIYNHTYEGVITAAGHVWQKYLLASVKEVRVIRYFYARQIRGDRFLNRGFDEHMVHHGLGLGYEIGYKIEIGDCIYFHNRSYADWKAHPMNQSLEKLVTGQDAFQQIKDWQYVEWTPELERFFEETTKSLNALIKKVDAFFGENPDVLLNNVKTQKNLLT